MQDKICMESMADNDASDASSYEDYESDCGGYDDDCEPDCDCGYPAKLRMSHTDKNPNRLFYNCHKFNRCDFFQWCDEPVQTGDKHFDELTRYRHECNRIQDKYEGALEEHANKRRKWEIERELLVSEVNNVRAELDEFKKRAKLAGESDLMPPVYPMSSSDKDESDSYDDDDDDDVKDIHAI
ncbi:hypothetical protein LINGRAHAP2_LOCUS35669 [Linum grandiflorum]